MKQMARKALQRVAPQWYWQQLIYKQLICNSQSFLHTTGWVKSIMEKKPLSNLGNPLPWMNYGVIAFLEERLQKSFSMFEYGSGSSTLFFANKVAELISVEYDIAWYNQIKPQVPANVQLLLKIIDANANEYVESIGLCKKEFDVILIDGRERMACLGQAIGFLKPDGVIILDDSERERYDEAFAASLLQGFKQLTFTGIKPCGLKMVSTTIFYRSNNCLGI